jgi:3-deoxy-D-manno-octulosonic acid (KDO) 8-phosphate synthase
MRGLLRMREFGYPIVFDATHSVQLPGARGTAPASGVRPGARPRRGGGGAHGLLLEATPTRIALSATVPT